MREYSKQEITREKCHFCGSKNKLFTELRKEDRTFVGMALRCCNCGKVTFHINPDAIIASSQSGALITFVPKTCHGVSRT